VGTTVIIKYGKVKYAWVTVVPMVFMFVTTLSAAYQLFFMFRAKAAAAKIAADQFNFGLDAALVALMAVLAVISLSDMLYKWYGYLRGTREMKNTEIIEYIGGEVKAVS
jgi:carbon starvation protein